MLYSGVSSLGVLGVPLADQLTLSQPGGADYSPPQYNWNLWIFRLSYALVLVKQDALKNSMSLLLCTIFIDTLVIVC